jgi:hypothetical protein
MLNRIDWIGTGKRLLMICVVSFGSLFLLASADTHKYSDVYQMIIQPGAKKTLGEETLNKVKDFYQQAEKAIETENLDDLMALYSDNYQNGEHTKESARIIWSRIFGSLDDLATRHNMQLIPSGKDDLVILRCSGLLVGIPEGEKYSLTVDNWNLQDHILTRENGQWKLIGNTGRTRKRLWFDQPMHPLF